MHPALASCRLALELLRRLILAVWARDAELEGRPGFARRAVAGRLKAGMRVIAAYLRRVLIVMALELEPTLKPRQVDEVAIQKRPLKRRKHPLVKRRRVRLQPVFHILAKPYRPVTDAAEQAWELSRYRRQYRRGRTGKPVSMARLYRQLEQLQAIAADPLPRAMRLAWWLARRWEGPIIAPDLYLRIPGRWGSEVSMMFDAMGYGILDRSKQRPPLLPPAPRRWRGPSITQL